MDGTSNNAVVNLVTSLIRKSSPELLETCPIAIVGFYLERYCHITKIQIHLFQGVRKVTNFTFDDAAWPSPLPNGLYRIGIIFGKFWTLQIDTQVTAGVEGNMG